MNPFIMIAGRLLLGIIQAIEGDTAGTVAGAVIKAVRDITRAKNPEEARDKLNADPDAYAAMQVELVRIANDYEQARLKAELDYLRNGTRPTRKSAKRISRSSRQDSRTQRAREEHLAS